MKKLELKVPPIVVFLLSILLMYGLKSFAPSFQVTVPFLHMTSFLFTVAALLIGGAAVQEFRKIKTTTNPIKPESASQMVCTGVFSYTRNPMYLAMLLLLIALGLWWEHLSVFLVGVLFVSYLNRFQIKPEERALETLFGAEYVEYKSKVHRWV
ncbi:hypothetical protein BS333_05670 [Vibrio azureus]|uniref:Isoprenylcysteine carboxylmethyltransferase family protein n=1 Tax=Vibrio azureus NBRC 104587 TaxID=1219077 RepID=U3A2H7_9VIBR|nr:isoprenylcysteine carboxylmethyltransferase family protein [Vibrio azureus]AUI85907.1 hypothetical protein BS333_05670 [Vibrio azureus]GAD74211.1 hypothetical protein VAZ01S_005_00110 [Vibrio azureus NBRC 104587]